MLLLDLKLILLRLCVEPLGVVGWWVGLFLVFVLWLGELGLDAGQAL